MIHKRKVEDHSVLVYSEHRKRIIEEYIKCKGSIRYLHESILQDKETSHPIWHKFLPHLMPDTAFIEGTIAKRIKL